MEATTTLKASKRERVGSRYSRRIREQGGLPAIVYGHKQDPVAVTLDAKETISHILKGEKVYILEIEGGETETVLLRDLQYDYLGTNIVHCDLARVDLNERVHTTVPIHLVGDAPGLKKSGAVLMHPATSIEIECTVTNIPDFIEVEIGELDVGDGITAGELELPLDTMRLLSDPNEMVAQIVMKAAVPDEGSEAAVVESLVSPERIAEKKTEEEGD